MTVATERQPAMPIPNLKEEVLKTPGMVEVFCPATVDNALTVLRDKNTSQADFVKAADNIAFALGMRVAEDLPIFNQQIETRNAPTLARKIDPSKSLLISILRSAHPLCEGIQKATGIEMALVDIKREHETAEPKLYYDGLPKSLGEYDTVYVPDPMLATGGSADMTIKMLKDRGAKKIVFISVIAAPEGIIKLNKEHPDVSIISCAVDDYLNEHKYIVPGLGDFGDLYYGENQPVFTDELKKVWITYGEDGRIAKKIDFPTTAPRNLE